MGKLLVIGADLPQGLTTGRAGIEGLVQESQAGEFGGESDLGSLPRGYARRLAALAQAGWFCHGTVVARPLRRKVAGRWIKKGPYYLWTGKSQGRTICYALSQEQYQAAKQAIAANRKVTETMARLQPRTLKEILTKLPAVRKRKQL